MKELLKIVCLFALLLIVIPSIALFAPKAGSRPVESYIAEADAFSETEAVMQSTEKNIFEQEDAIASEAVQDTEKTEADEDILKVLDFTSSQVTEIPLRDYVVGAVLAEMPAAYHSEALKAQAVAARTYAVRQREKQRLSPSPELMGADISNDSTKYQAYFTPVQAKSFFGDSYETYLEKAEKAVDDTEGLILMYEGEPIVAAFHSNSGGRTESAEVVWGSPVDYLVPVESEDDTKSPAYLDEQIFTAEEVRERVEKEYPEAELTEAAGEWIEIKETSASGTVTKMLIGGAEMTGADFRRLFSLRSANFTAVYNADEDKFYVTSKGYGHGVGMSQYGANAMAEKGTDFRGILMHYYTGAELADIDGMRQKTKDGESTRP